MQQNYYLPAEWQQQSAIWLTWPDPKGAWQTHFAAVEHTYFQLVQAITRYQAVLISFQHADQLSQVKQSLVKQGIDLTQLHCYVIPANDSWSRDHAAISLVNDTYDQQGVLLDFTFNGWGNKYPFEKDNQLSRNLFQQQAFVNAELQSIDLVLEGGAIETDGQGTLLINKSCVIDPARNFQHTEQQLLQQLKQLFKLQQIFCLDKITLLGDDTDGHIDTLARFCDPQTICYLECRDQKDPRYLGLHSLAEQLKKLTTINKQPYRLVSLPLPRLIRNIQGEILPATYANFLIINKAVLVPTYDDPMDVVALQILQACFPSRKIIAIDCQSLIQQFGSLHCVTMQIPTPIQLKVCDE